MFHPNWREQALSRLDEVFDLVVIGGGITGSGVLLDAAQRGLRTLLLERRDIASGTSSRSSKLVHGGLRYLKEMQFRVTKAASRERDRMVVLNPGLVRPMRFVYPANRGDKLPGWTVDLGLWMYDRLTQRPQKHAHLEEERVHQLVPGLSTENLEQAFAYTDARTDDAQLTLAVAATGFAYGGQVITRAEVLEILQNPQGRAHGVVFRDLEDGGTHRVLAHVVVNAAGVWVDAVRERFGREEKRLRPSRGIHLVVPRERLPGEAAVMVPSPDDGRPVFVIPHAEGVLVGTTDIYHDGSLEDPRPTRPEIAYLLRTLQTHFPAASLGPSDVRGAFAGLRPILDSHTDNPSEASREEELWEEDGLLTIAGGKLTTWRPMAEETVDAALKYLPEVRERQAAPCYTHGTPLVGFATADLPDRLRLLHDLDPAVARGMASRLRAASLWAPYLGADSSELRPLIDGTDLTAAEVKVHLAHGAVLHLEDLLLRRVRLGLWDPELALAVAPALRSLFQSGLGWSNGRWEEEEEAFAAALEGWTPEGAL